MYVLQENTEQPLNFFNDRALWFIRNFIIPNLKNCYYIEDNCYVKTEFFEIHMYIKLRKYSPPNIITVFLKIQRFDKIKYIHIKGPGGHLIIPLICVNTPPVHNTLVYK